MRRRSSASGVGVRSHAQHSRRSVADGDGFVQNPAHPIVGCELVALADPDRGELPCQLDVERIGGLVLHEFVEQPIVAKSCGGIGAHTGLRARPRPE